VPGVTCETELTFTLQTQYEHEFMFRQGGCDTKMVNMTIPEKSTKRERADATANHTRIITAAAAVFAERGREAEMREIAERAGVAVGTLYRHFANREDLLHEVLRQTLDTTLARLREAAAIDDPCDALRALMHELGRLHAEFQPLLSVIHDERLSRRSPDESEEQKKEVAGRFIAVIAGLIERGKRLGVFRPDLDPEVTAGALMGSVIAFELLAPTRCYAAIADSLADLYISPLVAQPAAG
jgi:AcrR family transcriptional regulator